MYVRLTSCIIWSTVDANGNSNFMLIFSNNCVTGDTYFYLISMMSLLKCSLHRSHFLLTFK